MNRHFIVRCASLAACAILLLARCEPERPRPEHAVLGGKSTLRGFQQIKDTDAFRADLGEDTGFSSGYRTRNVLFIEASGKARWLLPDNDHAVAEYRVSGPATSRFEEPPTLAVVALAIPVDGSSKVGDLYLFSPTGERIQRIADGVAAVQGTALTSGSIAVLYERPTGYVLAHYDSATFARVREVDVAVPALKQGGPTTG